MHVFWKSFESWLKILQISFFYTFSVNKFWWQKFSYDFHGLNIKFSAFFTFSRYKPFWKIKKKICEFLQEIEKI